MKKIGAKRFLSLAVVAAFAVMTAAPAHAVEVDGTGCGDDWTSSEWCWFAYEGDAIEVTAGGELLAADHDRVAGVVAALVAHYVVDRPA